MLVWRLRVAWGLLVVSIIGWPLSQLTVARHEPPFVLGLSWFAVIQGSLMILLAADVRNQQGDD